VWHLIKWTSRRPYEKRVENTHDPESRATQGFAPFIAKNRWTCRPDPASQKVRAIGAQAAEKMHEWETTGRHPGTKIFFPASTPTGATDSIEGDRHATDASSRAGQKRRRPLARPSQITCSEDAQ
jgi:hypothetical protein